MATLSQDIFGYRRLRDRTAVDDAVSIWTLRVHLTTTYHHPLSLHKSHQQHITTYAGGHLTEPIIYDNREEYKLQGPDKIDQRPPQNFRQVNKRPNLRLQYVQGRLEDATIVMGSFSLVEVAT